MSKIKFTKRTIFIISFFIFTLTIFYSTYISKIPKNNPIQEITKTMTINGNSMTPIINNGGEIKVQLNYYQKNTPKRCDIIVYQYSETKNPIIKRIRGIPNDKFEYKNNNIYINNRILTNSKNETYNINSKMLTLYANEYPIIPKDTYLILGETNVGTFDSSKIGLIHKTNIIGFVKTTIC